MEKLASLPVPYIIGRSNALDIFVGDVDAGIVII
jgi:hypothetical protein